MPLLEFLASSPDAVEAMSLQQIISACGDGKLRDGSVAAVEFRTYLERISSDRLKQFVDSCLTPGDKHYLALQDIVNEIGRRLELQIENGRYQGVRHEIGFDGIWTTSTGHSIVIEVKTTDAYRINLETVEGYRKKLVGAGRISEQSSVLIVVLREETGDLEAQVRGSRYAWGIRIISADSLMKLLLVKERTEDSTLRQIEQLLVPFEYTRLDRIIDITFAAVQDLEREQELSIDAVDLELVAPTTVRSSSQNRSSKDELDVARSNALNVVSKKFHVSLSRRSRAKYETESGDFRVICAVSRTYDDGRLWYAYHARWDDYLSKAQAGYFVLAVVGAPAVFVIPRSWIATHISTLWSTTRDDATYHHIVVLQRDGGIWSLSRRQLPPLDISEFLCGPI